MQLKDTTHTIKHDQAHPLAAAPHNKGAQFLLGAIIITFGWMLYKSHWFSMTVMYELGIEHEETGFFGLIPFVLDVVCFVGIIGFTGIWVVKDLLVWVFSGVTGWVKELKAKSDAGKNAEAAASNAATRNASGELTDVQIRSFFIDHRTRIKSIEKSLEAQVEALERMSVVVEALTEALNQIHAEKPSDHVKRDDDVAIVDDPEGEGNE